MPEVFNRYNGDCIEWSEQDRFDVRLMNEDYVMFNDFVNVHPETPSRVFS
jgi:hypothetical protein